MRIRTLSTVAVLLSPVLLLMVSVGMAGNPEPPGLPDSTFSYTLEDIYNRLDAGTQGAPSTFTEPDGEPGTGTGHTLDDVMAKAPVSDNTSGALPAEVLTGTTYWSLRTDGGSSNWGVMTGTMPNNGAVTIVPTTTNQTIAEGYHDGTGYIVGDEALVGWNIRSGATVFGVMGTCHRLPATGQTISYETSDDGYHHLGCLPLVPPCFGADGCNFNRTSLPWHSSSGTGFVDNGDGTVTDNLTGLVWLKNASCFGDRTWSEALTEANTLNSGECGLSDGSVEGDWRLPNQNELRSLIDPNRDNPSLPAGHPFTAAQWLIYWSSTTQDTNEAQAWAVNITNGYSGHIRKTWLTYSVWPVRAGQ